MIDGDSVVVELTRLEKFWSFHGDVRFPLRAIRAIRTPSSPWLTMRGWRATGVSIPGYAAMGKRRHGSGYDFTVVFKHRPTVVLECNGTEFGEVIVSVDDAATTGTRLAQAAGIAFDPTP
jgi:hypothetical protein